MYAVIREATRRPEMDEPGRAARQEFFALRARQPGFRGSLTVDAGEGRVVTIALWESEQAQAAAAGTLAPEAERLMAPSVAGGPARIVYQGPVVANDLTTR